jgi:flap endonuclease-1
MGIRNLNRFLREQCGDEIRVTHLSELSGKKIAIDISIYMYKFASDGVLLENMYLMLGMFRYYNIIPVFVFDGKPPAEKMELLQKRREDKMEARDEYDKLNASLRLNPDMETSEKQEIANTMDMLKRTFVHISKHQTQQVKELIRAYGATYYDAPGEADELCALLVVKKKVWACMSEDMDMFVYGCPRIIKYLSLLNHTVVLYDLADILNKLGISQIQLREICILSGTDYNMSSKEKCEPTLHHTLKLFKKYMKSTAEDDDRNNGFYVWLLQNTKYIKDYELLQRINGMFDLTTSSHDNIKIFENIKIMNSNISIEVIHEILKDDGFFFV